MVVIVSIVSGPTPDFVRVTACGALVVSTFWLPKLTLVAESATVGLMPVPESEAVCGLPDALSVIVNDAVSVPVLAGVNFTVTLQLLLGETLVPQSLVWEKDPLSVPVIEIALTASGWVPTFFSTTARFELSLTA